MKRILNVTLASLLAASTLAFAVSDADAMSRKRYCQSYARRVSNGVQGDHVAGGAALGAAAGGVYGGLTGGGAASNLITGLALGAVGGGIAGAVAGDNAKKEAYWQAYHDCLGY